MTSGPIACPWSPRRGAKVLLTALIPLIPLIPLLPATDAAAQTPERASKPTALLRADSLLGACTSAAASGEADQARHLADEAESLYENVENHADLRPAALTGRARIRTGCRIPLAEPMTQGRLLQTSNRLLGEALELDPDFWPARFNLAMNYYYAPEFFGRTDDAIDEFERLLDEYPDRAPADVMAEVHLRLGDLYLRRNRWEDARRLWKLGRERFPEDERFPARLKSDNGGGAASRGRRDAVNTEKDSTTAPYELEPLVVEVGSFSMGEVRSGTPLTRQEVYTTPGGTADVLQVFQTMPGVTRAGEGSDLYIRGGDPAESAVLLDGARLFQAGSFETLDGSIFGVLDPEILKNAYFSSGGFSARYGNALSGVLDVETEGRPRESSWRAGLNLVSAGLTARTPLVDRAGLWASGSATHTGLLLALQDRSDEYPDVPAALQGTVGLTMDPSPDLRLRATGLAESDETRKVVDALGYSGVFHGSTDTRLATLSARLSTSSRLTLRAVVGFTRRSTGFRLGVLDRARTDRAVELRFDGERALGSRAWLRTGVEATSMEALSRGRVPAGESLAPGSPAVELPTSAVSSDHVGGYLETGFRPLGDLALVLGLRTDRLPGERSTTVDPRVSLAYRTEAWTFRLGTGVFHQGRRRVRYRKPEGGEPSGVPRRATHLALGIQREGDVSLRAEAYHKAYDQYVADGGAGPRAVEGRARGLDLLVKWEAGGALAGWLSWSLLDAELRLADGRRVPSSIDVTHSLTAVATWTLDSAWEIGSTARYATGRPFTPILGPKAPGEPDPLYGALHGERMPHYLRVDGRLTHLMSWSGGLLVAYLEGLNLLGRRNVRAYTWNESYEERRPVESFFARTALILGVEVQLS